MTGVQTCALPIFPNLLATSNIESQYLIVDRTLFSGLATRSATPLPNLIAQFTGNTTSNTIITGVSISTGGVSGQVIPTGTKMTFQQTAAPTGFTKATTYNDYSMRIVSGAVSTGGSVAFSTALPHNLLQVLLVV